MRNQELIKGKTRRFGGKLSNFSNTQEKTFEQKHLKAYLRGWERFQYGFQTINGRREPMYFDVKEEWV